MGSAWITSRPTPLLAAATLSGTWLRSSAVITPRSTAQARSSRRFSNVTCAPVSPTWAEVTVTPALRLASSTDSRMAFSVDAMFVTFPFDKPSDGTMLKLSICMSFGPDTLPMIVHTLVVPTSMAVKILVLSCVIPVSPSLLLYRRGSCASSGGQIRSATLSRALLLRGFARTSSGVGLKTRRLTSLIIG